jgi:hypothetical protein
MLRVTKSFGERGWDFEVVPPTGWSPESTGPDLVRGRTRPQSTHNKQNVINKHIKEASKRKPSKPGWRRSEVSEKTGFERESGRWPHDPEGDALRKRMRAEDRDRAWRDSKKQDQ